MKNDYSFTHAEADEAFRAWGCNCGPSALAFALQFSIEAVRFLIPGFHERRYTNLTMMLQGIENAGAKWEKIPTRQRDNVPALRPDMPCLHRVQWTGPWTAPGMNPKWAYRHSHWICAWVDEYMRRMVFDINGGMRSFESWKKDVVPPLIASAVDERADGGYFFSHRIMVTR